MHHPHRASPSYATHPALHLRHAADAHVVFEAVRRGTLPLIKRRLTAEERDQLESGNIYVWEEAEHKGGLERWTDGRRWSQSRMKGDYLFYEEKVETTPEEKEAKAARRANKATSALAQTFTPSRRQDRPSKPDGLTKQTYSTQVYIPGAAAPRKWHIVAYFSGNDYTRLPVIENYEYLRDIRVPDGVFFSSKGAIKKTDRYSLNGGGFDHVYETGSPGSSESFELLASTPSPRSSAQEPRHWQSHGQSTRPYLLQHANNSELALPEPHRRSSHESTSLPRLSTIAPLSLSPGYPTYNHNTNGPTGGPRRGTTQPYSPLSSEDRRALNTFRVVL